MGKICAHAHTHTHTDTHTDSRENAAYAALERQPGNRPGHGHLGVSVKAWPWAWRHGRWCGRMRRRGSGQHSRAAGGAAHEEKVASRSK